MIWSDDPAWDAERWEEYKEKLGEGLPRCYMCGEIIREDYAYELKDGYICQECLDNHYKVNF